MSYAIIRNKNYKMGQLPYLYRHNERKNTDYKNRNIKRELSYKNYSLKKPISSYQKTFDILKKQYNLKGQIKTVSNVLCELVITSDNDFFERIGEKETRRYFQTAYKFVSNYQNLGEEFIVSAKVHLDETTPHLHIMYIPVIDTKDKKGRPIKKIACSQFWKGRESYRKLQNNFYSYMTKAGFDLERGNTKENEHIDIERLKKITNYEVQQFEKKSIEKEKPLETNNNELLQKQNRRVINKFNTLSNQYVKIRNNVYMIQKLNKKLQEENENLKIENDDLIEENQRLTRENKRLRDYIDKTLEYISLLINVPIKSIRNMINTFFEEVKERKQK